MWKATSRATDTAATMQRENPAPLPALRPLPRLGQPRPQGAAAQAQSTRPAQPKLDAMNAATSPEQATFARPLGQVQLPPQTSLGSSGSPVGPSVPRGASPSGGSPAHAANKLNTRPLVPGALNSQQNSPSHMSSASSTSSPRAAAPVSPLKTSSGAQGPAGPSSASGSPRNTNSASPIPSPGTGSGGQSVRSLSGSPQQVNQQQRQPVQVHLQQQPQQQPLAANSVSLPGSPFVKEGEDDLIANGTLHDGAIDNSGQVDLLTRENEVLKTQLDALKENLLKMKTMVADRLKREVENTQREKAAHEETKKTLTILNEEFANVRQQLGAVESERAAEIKSLRDELAHIKEDGTHNEGELERLRLHLQEADQEYMLSANTQKDALEEYKKQVFTLENERKSWEVACQTERENAVKAAEQIEELHIRMANVKSQMDELRIDRDERLAACESLERVLAEQDELVKKDIENKTIEYKIQVQGLENEISTYKDTLTEYENRINELTLANTELEKVREEADEKDRLISKLRQDTFENHQHLKEAMKRLQNNADQVDKPIITNLLISFLQVQRGDPKRFEILQIIASVLKLSDEDRVRIGISRPAAAGDPSVHQRQQYSGVMGAARKLSGLIPGQAGRPQQPLLEQQQQDAAIQDGNVGNSFTDRWISFLLKESRPSTENLEDVPTSPQDPQASLLPPAMPTSSEPITSVPTQQSQTQLYQSPLTADEQPVQQQQQQYIQDGAVQNNVNLETSQQQPVYEQPHEYANSNPQGLDQAALDYNQNVLNQFASDTPLEMGSVDEGSFYESDGPTYEPELESDFDHFGNRDHAQEDQYAGPSGYGASPPQETAPEPAAV